MLAEFINILFYFAALVVLSYLLDRMYSYSLARWVYIVFAAPGIIVHELSHYVACKLTGARVTRVRLISRTGGEVVHGKGKGGVFGQALISMAPFFGIPIVLILLGLLFNFALGCQISWELSTKGNVGVVVLNTLVASWELIWKNLYEQGAYWFILYVYMAASLTISLAPSKQDFRNSIWGLLAVFGITLVFIIIMESLPIDWPFYVLGFIIDTLGWVVVIGLISCLFGLLLGLPFFLVKYYRNRG